MNRRLALALALLVGAPSVLPAQYYFGQNKVQYRSFDFQVLRTEHFDVYFYPETRAAAQDAARMAERSYQRLSRLLRHEYKERKPIILYASHSDFQQTNALGGEAPGEGTGGVTDFFKQRIILPFTGSYEELEHVLQHEMVHQFQYDIWCRGRAGAGLATIININPPLWFVEGMAEYLSIGGVDPNTAMWLRDAAIEGKIPTIQQLENDYRIFPYRYGQSLVAYIGERWGDEAIGAILQGTLAGGGGLEGSIRRVLGVDYKGLSEQWHDDVQKTYLPEVATRQKARDIAQPIAHGAAIRGHAAPGAGPLARRQAGRLLQREGLLLRRPLSRRRGDRQGQAAAAQVVLQQQLRDLPVHQLRRQLVARRQVPRHRGQARTAGRHRRSSRSNGTGRPGASRSS